MSKKNKPFESSKRNRKTRNDENVISEMKTGQEQSLNNDKKVTELSFKKKLSFIIIMLSLPILIIGILELGLRLFNYGPDLSLFTKVDVYGTTYHVMNPHIKARYFPTSTVAEEITTDYFQMPKPQNTFRIFCLGASTAAGFPYWRNASFISFIHQRLNRIFPDRNIEVINLGMTAINSYTVLDIAGELPAYQPDLIIVYDGHAEFYGGLGIASNLTISSSRWVNLLYLQLIHSKVFLFVREIMNKVKSLFNSNSAQLSRNLTLELLAKDNYIPYGSQLYKEAENIFKLNMEDLQKICSKNKIPLILSTQVSNLRDMGPFKSVELKELSAEDKNLLMQHMSNGFSFWDKENWKEALEEFRAAVKIDYQFASAHFKIAECLEKLGNTNEALAEYFKARDYDQLRFRTSSDFNNLIKQRKNENTNVVDVERLFMALSPDSLIGNNLILEHVHPNSYGYFLMVKGYITAMKERNILASKDEWSSRDTISDEVLWNERTVTQLDEKVALRRTEILKAGQPFTDKYKEISTIAKDDTLGQIAEKVVDGTLGWINAHKSAAAFYLHKNDLENLEKEYKTIVNLNPFDLEPQLNLAQFYYNQKKLNESENVTLASLKIIPTLFAYYLLGDICMDKRNFNDAVKYYLSAKNYTLSSEEERQISYKLGFAYYNMGLFKLAETELLRAVRINPGDSQSVELLNKVQRVIRNN